MENRRNQVEFVPQVRLHHDAPCIDVKVAPRNLTPILAHIQRIVTSIRPVGDRVQPGVLDDQRAAHRKDVLSLKVVEEERRGIVEVVGFAGREDEGGVGEGGDPSGAWWTSSAINSRWALGANIALNALRSWGTRFTLSPVFPGRTWRSHRPIQSLGTAITSWSTRSPSIILATAPSKSHVTKECTAK